MPLTDWTTGDGGLDARHWLDPAPSGPWPPSAATFNGLGLTGQPTIYSKAYLKANIEGGQYFNWFYNDSNNLGIGLDPNGTELRVSLPQGDRLRAIAQRLRGRTSSCSRQAIAVVVEQRHQAVYDDGDGSRLAAAWARYAMAPAVEADHVHRIRLCVVRPLDQSAECFLRSGEQRKLHRLLVGLGSEPERAGELSGRGATISLPRSRCRRSTSIGSLTATTRHRPAACRCCRPRSCRSGTGTRGRFRHFPT